MSAKLTPKEAQDDDKQVGVSALERAISVLSAFEADGKKLTLAEISAKTGLYKSTAFRLIQSLVRYRLLRRFEDGSYSIGSGALRLASVYRHGDDIDPIILPVMRELAGQCGESVGFFTIEDGRQVCRNVIDPGQMLHRYLQEGDALPLEAGSAGQVLLAFSGDHDEGAAFAEMVRRDMYCATVKAQNPDIAGLAAPVFDADQTIAGTLTILGLRARMDERFVLANRGGLLAAASQITWKMGGDPTQLMAVAHQYRSAEAVLYHLRR
ncbi:IclR family transcriptional regulator [Ferrovibrio sp.]|uniref:IclR family transcriptional regulator n=1 Tax=Ferrovibrio sp. TaxID=1917215 RepID=UPI0031201790